MRLPVFLSVLMIHAVKAALIVSAPQPITHQVRVQPIQVSDSNGRNTATFMGSSSSETYIKGQIDRVWRQIGVEILWEPTATYNDTFTNKGSGNYSTQSRPTADLYTITADPNAPLASDPTIVNLFFVNISAGYKQLSGNQVAGLAKVDANGSTIFVGLNLVTQTNWVGGPDAGKDSVAAVIAHEIGHCLGLIHETTLGDNLMYSGSADQDPEYLISAQKTTILTDRSGIDGFEFTKSVVVEPPVEPETNFGVWAATHELTGGTEDDDDGDRLSNGFEFYFGFDPTVPSSLPAPTQTIQGLMWSLEPVQAAMDDGFTWIAETSSDLSNWLPAGTVGSKSQRIFDFANFNKVQFVLEPGHSGVYLRFGVLPPAILAADEGTAAMSGALEMAMEPDHSHECDSGCCHAVTVETTQP
jgi:hypothetical protein